MTLDAVPDDELMDRVARTDDRIAFAELMSRYEARLTARGLVMGWTEIEARDAAVGALLHMWEKRSSYRTGRSFVPWLFQRHLDVFVDYTRQRRRPWGATLSSSGPERERHQGRAAGQSVGAPKPDPAQIVALQGAIEKCMRALEGDERIVLQLLTWQSAEEMATYLHSDAGAIIALRESGLEKLRACLKGKGLL
jgi:DNA-directed RNA polymerase specialized sigma24 family protein